MINQSEKISAATADFKMTNRLFILSISIILLFLADIFFLTPQGYAITYKNSDGSTSTSNLQKDPATGKETITKTTSFPGGRTKIEKQTFDPNTGKVQKATEYFVQGKAVSQGIFDGTEKPNVYVPQGPPADKGKIGLGDIIKGPGSATATGDGKTTGYQTDETGKTTKIKIGEKAAGSTDKSVSMMPMTPVPPGEMGVQNVAAPIGATATVNNGQTVPFNYAPDKKMNLPAGTQLSKITYQYHNGKTNQDAITTFVNSETHVYLNGQEVPKGSATYNQILQAALPNSQGETGGWGWVGPVDVDTGGAGSVILGGQPAPVSNATASTPATTSSVSYEHNPMTASNEQDLADNFWAFGRGGEVGVGMHQANEKGEEIDAQREEKEWKEREERERAQAEAESAPPIETVLPDLGHTILIDDGTTVTTYPGTRIVSYPDGTTITYKDGKETTITDKSGNELIRNSDGKFVPKPVSTSNAGEKAVKTTGYEPATPPAVGTTDKTGVISFDKNTYKVADTVTVRLTDQDLNTEPNGSNPVEPLTYEEQVFRGEIERVSGNMLPKSSSTSTTVAPPIGGTVTDIADTNISPITGQPIHRVTSAEYDARRAAALQDYNKRMEDYKIQMAEYEKKMAEFNEVQRANARSTDGTITIMVKPLEPIKPLEPEIIGAANVHLPTQQQINDWKPSVTYPEREFKTVDKSAPGSLQIIQGGKVIKTYTTDSSGAPIEGTHIVYMINGVPYNPATATGNDEGLNRAAAAFMDLQPAPAAPTGTTNTPLSRIETTGSAGGTRIQGMGVSEMTEDTGQIWSLPSLTNQYSNRLKVGALEETVTVTGESPLIDNRGAISNLKLYSGGNVVSTGTTAGIGNTVQFNLPGEYIIPSGKVRTVNVRANLVPEARFNLKAGGEDAIIRNIELNGLTGTQVTSASAGIKTFTGLDIELTAGTTTTFTVSADLGANGQVNNLTLQATGTPDGFTAIDGTKGGRSDIFAGGATTTTTISSHVHTLPGSLSLFSNPSECGGLPHYHHDNVGSGPGYATSSDAYDQVNPIC